MINKAETIEGFLNTSKKYISGDCTKVRSKDIVKRSSLAMEGENPCEHCRLIACANVRCIPYYIYFSNRWNKLRRRFGK